MIYQQVTLPSFQKAFRAAGLDEATFTDDGLRVLFDHLERTSRETGQDTLLNVVDLYLDWEESRISELRGIYTIPENEDALEWLKRRTTVLPSGEGHVVFANF